MKHNIKQAVDYVNTLGMNAQIKVDYQNDFVGVSSNRNVSLSDYHEIHKDDPVTPEQQAKLDKYTRDFSNVSMVDLIKKFLSHIPDKVDDTGSQALLMESSSSVPEDKIVNVKEVPERDYKINTVRTYMGMQDCDPNYMDMEHAVNMEDQYIGTVEDAEFFHSKGIYPQLASPKHKVCSIGKCKNTGRWYGWSHRAMSSFGIGHMVRKGHSGYNPDNIEGFVQKLKDRYVNPDDFNVKTYIKGNKVKIIRNCKQHGTGKLLTFKSEDEFIPGKKGEWTAVTEEDAMQMAKDFAESVSCCTTDNSKEDFNLTEVEHSLYGKLDAETGDYMSEIANIGQKETLSTGPIMLKNLHEASQRSLSASNKPTSYGWYIYVAPTRTLLRKHHDDFEGTLSKNDLIGIRYDNRNQVYKLVDNDDTSIEFTLSLKEIKRVLSKSKGYSGKINGQAVVKGDGNPSQFIGRKLAAPRANSNITKSKQTTKGIKGGIHKVAATTYFAYFVPSAHKPQRVRLITNQNLAALKKELSREMTANSTTLGSEAVIVKSKMDSPLVEKILAGKRVHISQNVLTTALSKERGDKVKFLPSKLSVQKSGVALPKFNETKAKPVVPIFDGNEQKVLQELRNFILFDKFFTGAFKVATAKGDMLGTEGKGSRAKAGYAGIVKDNKGSYTLTLLSQDTLQLRDEAKAAISRIQRVYGKRIQGAVQEFSKGGTTAIVLKLKVVVDKLDEAGKKRRLQIQEGIENKTLVIGNQYFNRISGVDHPVELHDLDISKGTIMVRALRAGTVAQYLNVDNIYTRNGEQLIG